MTWLHTDDAPDEPRHAGHLLGRLTDGTIPTYRVGKLLAERPYTDAPEGGTGGWHGPEFGRPEEQPAYLVPACECGWHGTDVPNVGDDEAPTSPGHEAYRAWHDHASAALTTHVPTSHRQALAQLAATLGELADERPRAALILVRQLQELAELAEPLAVAGALAHRVSWPIIGSDLGQTRQAVHGRYKSPSADLTDRVHRLTGRTVESLLERPVRGRTAHAAVSKWDTETSHLRGTVTAETLPITITRSTWEDEITPHPTSRWLQATERVTHGDTLISLYEPGGINLVGQVIIGARYDDETTIREWAQTLTQIVAQLEAVRPNIDAANRAVDEAKTWYEATPPNSGSEREARRELYDAERQATAVRTEVWTRVRDAYRLNDDPAAVFRRWFEQGGTVEL